MRSRRHRVSKRKLYLADNASGDRIELTEEERSTHLHVVGASGTGKSRFLEHLIRQDIKAGRGVCVIDPHGTLCQKLIGYFAGKRRVKPEGFHVIQPGREDWTFGFNPLDFSHLNRNQQDFGVKSVVSAIAKVWGGEDMSQTPRLQRILKLVCAALVELELPLPAARHLLVARDPDGVRDRMIQQIRNPGLRHEWEQLAGLRPSEFLTLFESTQNRLNNFINSEVIASMLSQTEAAIDVAEIIANGEVLLVDLSDQGGSFSAEDASLFGALLLNEFVLQGFQRGEGGPAFHLYIDECHHYLTPDIERILYEGRKFGLHLTLANQDLSELKQAGESTYGAVMSGAQTKVVFQLSRMAEAKEMAEERMACEIDYERIKQKIVRQEVIGYDVIELFSRGKTKGESHTLGSATARTQHSGQTDTTSFSNTHGEGVGVNEGTAETLDLDGEVINTSNNSSSSSSYLDSWTSGGSTVQSSGQAHSEQTNRSDTESDSYTRTVSQTLRPILAESRTQTYSLEEQLHAQAYELNSLPKRHALLFRKPEAGTRTIERFRTPEVKSVGRRGQRRAISFELRSLETSRHAVRLIEADPRDRVSDVRQAAEPPLKAHFEELKIPEVGKPPLEDPDW